MKINVEREGLRISNSVSDIKSFFIDGSVKVYMLDEKQHKIMDIIWDASAENVRDYYVVNEKQQYILLRLSEIIRDYREVFLVTEGEETLRFTVKNLEDGTEIDTKILGRGQEYNAVWIGIREKESGEELEFRHVDRNTSDLEAEKVKSSQNTIHTDSCANWTLKDMEEKILQEDIPLVARYSDAAGTEAAVLKTRLEALLKVLQEEDAEKLDKEGILTQFLDIEKCIYEKLYKPRRGKLERIRENL